MITTFLEHAKDVLNIVLKFVSDVAPIILSCAGICIAEALHASLR